MNAYLALLAALAILLISQHSHAFRQDQYAIEVSPASTRLSQQSVGQIFQDRDGFIWLLTQEGLNRYNGYDVTSFTASRSDDQSLSHQYTTDIAEDRNGTLWISTLGGGLNALNKANLTFRHVIADATISNQKPLSNFVTAIESSASGDLWIGYADGRGFSFLNVDTMKFDHYFIPGQPQGSYVSSFHETADGNVIIAAPEHGVFVKSAMNNEVARLETLFTQPSIAPPTNVSNMLRLSDGYLLLASYTEGAFQLDTQSMVLERHGLHDTTQADTANEIYDAYLDNEGNLWFGTSAGLAVYAADRQVTWITSANSNLPDDQVLSIFQSDVGMMWFGTYSGLAQGTRTLFQKFSEADGLPNNAVFSINSDEQGYWWVGTEAGLARLLPETNETNEISVKSSPEVLLREFTIMSIAVVADKVFAGSLDSGLFEIDLAAKGITHHKPSSSPGDLTFGGVPVLQPLDEKQLLVGTYGGGLNIYDIEAGSFTAYRHKPSDPESISDDRIISLLIDSAQRVWVGTADGLNIFEPESKKFRQFAYDQNDENTISSNVVLSLAEDRNGDIWVGTRSGGLNLLQASEIDSKTPKFSRPLARLGIPSSDIYSVSVDSNDRLWLSHNAGLSLISSSRDEAKNYDETSGLQGPEFNHGAAHRTLEGTLLVGGQNGLNAILADNDFERSYQAPLRLIDFKLLNERVFFEKPYASLTDVYLDYDYQFASFEFAALDFRRPNNVLYRYRIDGIHNEWIDLGRNRQVSISGLGAGNYKVRISATNSDRVWNDGELSFDIHIAPPFWMRWYAFAVYAAILLYAVFTFIQRQNAKTREEQERRIELENRVQERTADLQIARNQAEAAAKAKADFLATMSHEIRTPMHGMIGMTDLLLQSGLTRQQESFALTARDSGQSLLEIVNSILDYSKLEASKLQVNNDEFDCRLLVENVASLLVQNAKKSRTTLLIEWTECEHRILHGDAGKVRQIIINLVGNAIKFTKGGSVLIRCAVNKSESQSRPSSEQLRLTVSIIDTGIGIDEEKLSSIFDVFTQADTSTTREYGGTGLGLSISKELAELMGGNLSVSSQKGRGSKFTLDVPILASGARSEEPLNQERKCYCLSKNSQLSSSIISRLALNGIEVEEIDSPKSIEMLSGASPVLFVDEESFIECNQILTGAGIETFALQSMQPTSTRLPQERVILPPYRESDLIAAFSGEIADVKTRTMTQEDQTLAAEVSQPATSKILVVEDVEVNQRIAESMLQALGCSIDIASNGREGVELAKRENYDVILMDCQMPILDGYSATREIRAFEAMQGRPKTPIFALTAGGDDAEESQVYEVGMDKLVRKPFTLLDLRSAFLQFGIQYTDMQNTDMQTPGTEQSILDSADEVLDAVVLDGLAELAKNGGDTSLISKLLEGYTKQFEQKHSELAEVFETRQKSEVKKVAHAIKSMSANMGAKLVRSVAERIEQEGEQYDFSLATKDVADLQRHKDSFYKAYKKRFDIP